MSEEGGIQSSMQSHSCFWRERMFSIRCLRTEGGPLNLSSKRFAIFITLDTFGHMEGGGGGVDVSGLCSSGNGGFLMRAEAFLDFFFFFSHFSRIWAALDLGEMKVSKPGGKIGPELEVFEEMDGLGL